MKFTYRFGRNWDEIFGEIETHEALPHLEAGNILYLAFDEAGPGPQLIKSVEIQMSHLGGQFRRYDVWIFCEPADRADR